MKILAIDTALAATSACVFETGAGSPEAAESVSMERGHAEALLPLIARVMAASDGGFDRLARIAVTVGPGSFTGLRIGIAAARAIALARQLPVVGVSTLAALAAPLILEKQPGLAVAAIDAHHGNIYLAAFGSDGRTLVLPRLVALRDAMRILEPGPLRLIGSGAPMLAIEASAAGREVRLIDEAIAPDIFWVAKLGLLADPQNSPARPLYLKAPDVKPPARQPAVFIP
ncbi:MAG TPA: tRNA (adenosine(37)-N6)-threonylcarbamoyltransferase complex dimerization subunit type 1 TsaB [Methylovirgula sp.]